jgi:hypothetical protein
MSEDIRFATFRGCEPGAGRNAQILIFKVDDGQYAFVMPRAWTSQFQLPTPSWFYNFDLFLFTSDFREFKEVIALLPQPMAEYATNCLSPSACCFSLARTWVRAAGRAQFKLRVVVYSYSRSEIDVAAKGKRRGNAHKLKPIKKGEALCGNRCFGERWVECL